jgi:hypothetical protein
VWGSHWEPWHPASFPSVSACDSLAQQKHKWRWRIISRSNVTPPLTSSLPLSPRSGCLRKRWAENGGRTPSDRVELACCHNTSTTPWMRNKLLICHSVAGIYCCATTTPRQGSLK